MKLKKLLPLALLLGSGSAFAACEGTIEGNDMMMFDLKEMTVPAGCSEYKVTLKHVGVYPEASMGHNWVLTTTADFMGVAGAAPAAGMMNEYVPQGDARVLAFTEVIGGGEETSVTVDVSKLQAGGDYTYFCSFPGHFAMMKGKLIVQ